MTVIKDVVTGRKSQLLLDRLQGSLVTGQYKPGQQFHSIKELCKMYDVSSATVIKCLGQLEHEGVLTRKQGSGTYIRQIPNLASLTTSATGGFEIVPCIDFIVPDNIGSRSGLGDLEELISVVNAGMHRDNLSVRVGFLPSHLKERKEVENWLEQRRMSGAKAFIFRWMPRLVQEIAQEKKLSACVNGHPDTGITLPFIDDDQEQIGRIVAEHLTSLNCQRIGVLMRAEWRPGDNVMFNSLLRSLSGRLVGIETATQIAPEIDAACQKLMNIEPAIDALVIRSEPGSWLLDYIDTVVAKSSRHIRIVEAMASASRPWHPLIDTLAPDGSSPADAYRECLQMLMGGKYPESTGTLIKMRIVPGTYLPPEQEL